MRDEFVHIAWKTPKGGWRRSFAVRGERRGQHLVTYHLVEKDTDGKNETVVGFATDSTIRVRHARLNRHYCELEVVERIAVDAVDGHVLFAEAQTHNATHNETSRIDVEVHPKASPNGDDVVILTGPASVLGGWLETRGYLDGDWTLVD